MCVCVLRRLQWDEVLAHPFWRESWVDGMMPPGGGPGGVVRKRQRQAESMLKSGSVDVMRLSQVRVKKT